MTAHQLVPELLDRRARDAQLAGGDVLAQRSEHQDGHVIHRSPTDVRHLDAVSLGDAEPAQLRVPVVTALPAIGDDATQLLIACAGAQRLAQVDAGGCEEAGEEPPVDAEPGSRAIAAER